ncbi:hypothetical protein AGMMS49587_07210 [Spirochaetia bacterium]|nr:hypothetical protein AGMMS49587_07210 [Spirochaetia bacterium]
MKKAFAIMMVAAVIGTAAFAQEKPGLLSAGVIGVPLFGTYLGDANEGLGYAGFGFGAFFDAKYGVVSLGMDIVRDKYEGLKDLYSAKFFSIGLLGKYPIAIGNRFTIAPAFGFEYMVFTSWGPFKRADAKKSLEGSGYSVANQYDNFVLKFGALADYTITGGLYARLGVLFDIGLSHKDAKDSKFGAEIPFGIGYRF